MIKKNISHFVLTISILVLLISCNNNQKETEEIKEIKVATNLEELKEKYANYKFKDCDELIKAGDEMIDVYIATINKAYEGDSLAKKDLDRFDTFLNKFDIVAEELANECPNKFEEWAEKTDLRVSEVNDKLFEIYKIDYDSDILEYDEELEKELEKNIEDLNKRVEEVMREDKKES